MKNKFWNYVLYNYLRKVKSKAFIGFNIFLIVMGLLISQLGAIIKFFNETFDYSETIYVVDETNQLYSQFEKDLKNFLSDVSIAESHETTETLDTLVKKGDISAYFVISYDDDNLLSATYVANDFSNTAFYNTGQQILSGYNSKLAMETAGLTETQINLINRNFNINLIALDEKAMRLMLKFRLIKLI